MCLLLPWCKIRYGIARTHFEGNNIFLNLKRWRTRPLPSFSWKIAVERNFPVSFLTLSASRNRFLFVGGFMKTFQQLPGCFFICFFFCLGVNNSRPHYKQTTWPLVPMPWRLSILILAIRHMIFYLEHFQISSCPCLPCWFEFVQHPIMHLESEWGIEGERERCG